MVKKYGVILLLYVVIVGSVIFINERFKVLNQENCISQTR